MNSEKLDTMLSIMNNKTEHRVITPEMVNAIISAAEFEVYALRLIKDGYAIMSDRNKSCLALTEHGVAYIRKGGYTLNSNLFYKKKRNYTPILLLFLLGSFVLVGILFIKVYRLLFSN